MRKKLTKKQEVYFIATKYKDQPAKIDFYTKSGQQIPANLVEKKHTREGIKLFVQV